MVSSNWNVTMVALAEKAAEQLQGTCRSLIELGFEFEEAQNDEIFCATLDQLVFECEQCNWWHEQSEMADREDEKWVCEECSNEGD